MVKALSKEAIRVEEYERQDGAHIITYRNIFSNGKLVLRVHRYNGGNNWFEDVYDDDGKYAGYRMYKSRYKELRLKYENVYVNDGLCIVKDFDEKTGELVREREFYEDRWAANIRKDGKVIVREFDKGKVVRRYEGEGGVIKEFDGDGRLLVERKDSKYELEIKEFDKTGKIVLRREGKYEYSGANVEKILLKEFDGEGRLVREYDINESKGSTKIYEGGEMVAKRSRHDGIGELIAWDLRCAVKHYSIY